jgi:hypothetical protein
VNARVGAAPRVFVIARSYSEWHPDDMFSICIQVTQKLQSSECAAAYRGTVCLDKIFFEAEGAVSHLVLDGSSKDKTQSSSGFEVTK